MSRFPLMAAVAAVLAVSSIQATDADAQGMRYSVSRPMRQNPELNNLWSARYDYLLQTNRGFRNYRMWKECHTITWPGLHDHCLSTFDEYEPWLGR